MDIEQKFKNTMRKMNRKEINEVLEFFSDIWNSPVCMEFDYSFITIEEVPNIIKKAKEHNTSIDIHLNQGVCPNCNNPIFWWVFECEHTLIYDWLSLRESIIDGTFTDITEEEKEYIIEQFGTPTLTEYLAKKYDLLHQEVRYALEQEVNEFYNIYKDDIKITGGDAYSISDNMMLCDAIWNYGPLFCSNTITDLIEKIYKKRN